MFLGKNVGGWGEPGPDWPKPDLVILLLLLITFLIFILILILLLPLQLV